MDVNFWASSGPSANHFSAVQAAHPKHHTDSYLIMADAEGDEDVRAWFLCPFCYVEIEVHVLCSHLQEVHCFDLTNAVCPICAANLGKDAIGHFTVQHAHSVKRRRKSQKSGLWRSSAAAVGKDLQGLSSFIGYSSRDQSNLCEPTPDPLLSPFLCPVSLSDLKEDSPNDFASTTPEEKSAMSLTTIPDETQKQDREEKRQRAAFVQQLIISTIF